MMVILATQNGVILADTDGRGLSSSMLLHAGHDVTSVIAREGVILAGTTDGVWRSDDFGRTWEQASSGLTNRHIRWLAYHPDISDLEFAGTEPAALYVSQDGGDRWQERPKLALLRDKHGWWLPYSPEAGCVRGFAFHGQRAYAAVEVGGLLRSDDNGASWRLAAGSDGRPVFARPQPGLLHPDVHSIEVHPTSPDQLLAPTGGGLYRSTDGGKMWQFLWDGYVRAAWWDKDDPAHFVIGSAENASGRNGNVLETKDGGQTWQTAANGLATPWRRRMIERFAHSDDHVFAVTSDGQFWQVIPDDWRWTQPLPSVSGVRAVTTMQ